MKKCLLFFLLFVNGLFCETDIQKKQSIAICAIFKNEKKFIKEWLEYHLLIGIDHFFLYENNSSDEFFEILKPYLKKGVVTVVRWPDLCLKKEADPHWALSTQASAYENAINFLAKNRSKWLVFLNMDEYLVPVEKNIKDLLEKYDQYPGIILSGDCFDATRRALLPQRKLVIETIELTAPRESYTNKEKIIFKPELCSGFSWPPYRPSFREKAPVRISRGELRINEYQNRNRGIFQSDKKKQKMAMDIREIPYPEAIELMNQGYEFEDRELAIFQFVPKLLQKMSLESVL